MRVNKKDYTFLFFLQNLKIILIKNMNGCPRITQLKTKNQHKKYLKNVIFFVDYFCGCGMIKISKKGEKNGLYSR
jgi:hypothetical protein